MWVAGVVENSQTNYASLSLGPLNFNLLLLQAFSIRQKVSRVLCIHGCLVVLHSCTVQMLFSCSWSMPGRGQGGDVDWQGGGGSVRYFLRRLGTPSFRKNLSVVVAFSFQILKIQLHLNRWFSLILFCNILAWNLHMSLPARLLQKLNVFVRQW